MLKEDIINELLKVLPEGDSVLYVYVKFVDKNGEEMIVKITQKTD